MYFMCTLFRLPDFQAVAEGLAKASCRFSLALVYRDMCTSILSICIGFIVLLMPLCSTNTSSGGSSVCSTDLSRSSRVII